MPRIPNSRAREYRSELRAQQADETRSRILDATGRVMARGILKLSIPAVAREAGVSVPTVYRHFGTKEELVAAIYPHAMARAGIRDFRFPRTVDEIREGVRAYLGQLDSLDDLDRAAMASPASAEPRQLSMPRRIAVWHQLVDSIEPRLAPADRDRLVRLLAVLLTSSSMRMWRDHLGASVDQTADDVDWVVRAAVAAARRRKGR
ncbi:MAG: helix-turn-helix domain-containing protein [Chloroflexota bacterium]